MPNKMDIDTAVQEKIDNDTEFQTSLTDLSEEDKQVAINEKRSVLIKSEFESLDKIAKENEKKFNDQKLRAEKAENELKNNKVVPKEEGLSQKDVIYLAKADIHEEDVDEVVELAKLKKITVAEAHKYMTPILETRAEERKTASATQTKGGARGSVKVTGEDLMAQARKGKLPETDEDWDKLQLARLEAKRTKK